MSDSIKKIASLAELEQSTPGKSEPIISLEDMLKETYARSAVDNQQIIDNITKIQQGPLSADNLLKLQEATSTYHITASLNSTLCRKASSTVETLLRA